MKKYKAEFNNKQYIIEQDLPEAGWYLHIYENGKCTHDYLQDKLETAKEQAKEGFDVPLDIWIEIEESTD